MNHTARIGCSSWTSEAWSGRLYPPGIKNGDRLAYYAKLYDTVEIDSTYYRDPGASLFRRWRSVTPDNFTFAVKFPRDLLDPKKDLDPKLVGTFITNARELGPKLGPILLQFPPWVKPGRATAFIEGLLDLLAPEFRYSVELRSKEWFTGETWRWLKGELGARRIALTWSYLTYVTVPKELTTDFVYLRFIGDHTTVPDEQHGEIRVNRDAEIQEWAAVLTDALKGHLGSAFAYFNNHFQGFAPESVNLFRKHMGLDPIAYAPKGSLYPALIQETD